MKFRADFFILFLVFIFKSTADQDTSEISSDYYFGVGELRTKENKSPCKDSNIQILCHMKCGGDHICLDGKCVCFKALVTSINFLSTPAETKTVDSGEVSEYESEDVDHVDLSEKTKGHLIEKPVLRHQIAHFCSNLSLARKCIMKCMSQGKPAFCGKDHVCYCGHTETHSHASGGEGQLDAYAEFKDMYNKYLHGLGLEAVPES